MMMTRPDIIISLATPLAPLFQFMEHILQLMTIELVRQVLLLKREGAKL